MGEFTLKKSDIRRLSNSLMTWIWRCPFCDYKGIYETHGRGLLAARLHLEKKHGLKVVVSDE